MKTFTLTTLATALFTALALAAPTPELAHTPPGFRATITFFGAAGASYTLTFPTNGSSVAISNPLSVSKISSLGGATCGFTGIKGSKTTVVGASTVDVGPPQTQISGSCLKL